MLKTPYSKDNMSDKTKFKLGHLRYRNRYTGDIFEIYIRDDGVLFDPYDGQEYKDSTDWIFKIEELQKLYYLNTLIKDIKGMKKFKAPKNIEFNIRNRDLERGFNELPFYYTDPNNTLVTWICNKDHEGKITSILMNSELEEKFITYIDTIEQAIQARNELIQLGWVEWSLPEFKGLQENWDAIPRKKQRAYIRKTLKETIKEEKDVERRGRLREKLRYEKELKEKNKRDEEGGEEGEKCKKND